MVEATISLPERKIALNKPKKLKFSITVPPDWAASAEPAAFVAAEMLSNPVVLEVLLMTESNQAFEAPKKVASLGLVNHPSWILWTPSYIQMQPSQIR